MLPLARAPVHDSSLSSSRRPWPKPQLAQKTQRSPTQPRGSARMSVNGSALVEAYYYTALYLGTPPKPFYLILDTGSPLTYVACSSCGTACGPLQVNRFNSANSTSFKSLTCSQCSALGHACEDGASCAFGISYAEGSSAAGTVMSDLATFGPSSTIPSTRVAFGCTTKETHLIYSQAADGLMGLSRLAPMDLPGQLVNAKAMADEFSLCFGSLEEGGGAMIMGAVTPPRGMTFTPILTDKGDQFYDLNITQIRVGNKALPLSNTALNGEEGTILDSGTTFTYVSDDVFQAFSEIVSQAAGALGMTAVPGPTQQDTCFGPASKDALEAGKGFPNVTYVFAKNMTHVFGPDSYLFPYGNGTVAYCLTIFANGQQTILGGSFVSNTMVMYDRARSRIGFWKTNCTSLFETLDSMSGPKAPPGTPKPTGKMPPPPLHHHHHAIPPESTAPSPSEALHPSTVLPSPRVRPPPRNRPPAGGAPPPLVHTHPAGAPPPADASLESSVPPGGNASLSASQVLGGSHKGGYQTSRRLPPAIGRLLLLAASLAALLHGMPGT